MTVDPTAALDILSQFGVAALLWFLLQPLVDRLGALPDILVKLVESSTAAHTRHAAAVEDLRDSIETLPSRLHQANAYQSASQTYRVKQ